MAEVVYVLSGELAWFEHCRRFGERFELPFDSAIASLKQFPEMGPPYEIPPFRRLFLPRTNWGVFYVIEGDRIVIHTILDLRQKPDSIRKFLGSLLPDS